MAIDPSIALGFRQPEAPSQLNMLAQAMQLQGLQRQNQMGALDMQDRQAAVAEREALRNYLGGGANIDTPEGQAGLFKAAPTQAPAILKGRADLKNTQAQAASHEATARTKDVELVTKTAEQFKGFWGQVQSPEQAAQLIQAAYAHPVLGKSLPGTAEDAMKRIPADPAGFQQYVQRQVLGADEFIKRTTMTAAESAQRAEQARHNKATEGLTVRGQNMTDARARETAQSAMSKPFEVTGPDGMPMLVQQDKQGNISPVQGFGPKTGSSKPLTDAQAKALLFGTRAQEANKALDAVAGGYSPMAINAKNAAERVPLVGGLLGPAGNAMLSDNSQLAEQAQRDFINAVLRRESGAVISDSEFDNARKQYFPQPGDSKAVLSQKGANRSLAIKGMLAEVPEGRRASITPEAAPVGGAFSDAEKERRYQEWKARQK